MPKSRKGKLSSDDKILSFAQGNEKKKPKKLKSTGQSSDYSGKQSTGKKGKSKGKGTTTKATTGSTPRQSSPRRSLDPIREQLQIMVDEANARVEELTKSNMPSRALEEARRTRLKSWGEDAPMFRADLARMRDLKREFARAQTFLADYTSKAEGAENFAKELGSTPFGGQFYAEYGVGYDPNVVEAGDASKVFEIYRRVLEQGGGWERVIGHLRAINAGPASYGSEQLINSIYDMVQNIQMPYTAGLTPKEQEEDFIQELTFRAYAQVESMIQMYDKMAEMQVSGENYGILGDQFDKEKYDRWKWKMMKEEMEKGR